MKEMTKGTAHNKINVPMISEGTIKLRLNRDWLRALFVLLLLLLFEAATGATSIRLIREIRFMMYEYVQMTIVKKMIRKVIQ